MDLPMTDSPTDLHLLLGLAPKLDYLVVVHVLLLEVASPSILLSL